MTSVAEEIIFQKDKNIYIFADYDVDGLTSGFILSSFLKDILGYKVETYYPERSEGYGLSPAFANNLNDKDAVVITVDNGITANEAVSILSNKCIPTIIIDHHEPADELPDAVELCDAHIDKNYGTHLCCAAVIWKVVHKIAELLGWPEDKLRLLDRSYLPYVALGTISDVMPPVLENYAIIALGLEEINKGQSNTLSSLMEQEGIKRMTSKDLAWTIAPELNACSRMGNVQLGKDFFSQEMANKKTVLQKLTKGIIKLYKRGIRHKKLLSKENIHRRFLVGCGVVIKEAHDAFAEVIERVLYLACTGDEGIFIEMYFGKILTEEIEV